MRSDGVLTVSDLIDRWRVSRTTVEARIRERRFPRPVVKVKRKPRLWAVADIERWEKTTGVTI